MITYKNSYAVGDKFYADIIAKQEDKIFVDDLGNGSTLTLMNDTTSPIVEYIFDEEGGYFHGEAGGVHTGWKTDVRRITFTLENTGHSRQRIGEAVTFDETIGYTWDIVLPDGTETTYTGTPIVSEHGEMASFAAQGTPFSFTSFKGYAGVEDGLYFVGGDSFAGYSITVQCTHPTID